MVKTAPLLGLPHKAAPCPAIQEAWVWRSGAARHGGTAYWADSRAPPAQRRQRFRRFACSTHSGQVTAQAALQALCVQPAQRASRWFPACPQVTVDPIRFDPWLYTRLHAVLAAARRVGIHVVARIGWCERAMSGFSWQAGVRAGREAVEGASWQAFPASPAAAVRRRMWADAALCGRVVPAQSATATALQANVISRLLRPLLLAGYGHNYNPDNAPHADERCDALLADRGKLMAAWIAYVRSLQAAFQHYDNFVFAFTSWEVCVRVCLNHA